MAFEFPGQIISLPTTQNLTAATNQYKPVSVNSGGNVILSVTSGGHILGILQNLPASTNGGQCSVMISGVSKVYREGATPAIGERAGIIVGTTLGGTKASSAGQGYIIGRALTPATTLACTYSVLITHEGPSATGYAHSAAA